ncbi:hypothetical protein VTN00DRAFT_8980 [Thermoascus crustaceus]|uniref:uncharacterized protein n=1 Tax=Thermoascus crustaceus TaxID=5088 RepID=UPI00374256BB
MIISGFDEVVSFLNSTEANCTLFVPTNKAFEKALPEEPPMEQIRQWVWHHISPGVDPCEDQLPSWDVTLNFVAHITNSNIHATNGIIHVVDDMLSAPSPASDTLDYLSLGISTFNLGLNKTGVTNASDGILSSGGTLFAPTDSEFANLGFAANALLFSGHGEKYIEALLEYHIVANQTLFTNIYYAPGKEAEDRS